MAQQLNESQVRAILDGLQGINAIARNQIEETLKATAFETTQALSGLQRSILFPLNEVFDVATAARSKADREAELWALDRYQALAKVSEATIRAYEDYIRNYIGEMSGKLIKLQTEIVTPILDTYKSITETQGNIDDDLETYLRNTLEQFNAIKSRSDAALINSAKEVEERVKRTKSKADEEAKGVFETARDHVTDVFNKVNPLTFGNFLGLDNVLKASGSLLSNTILGEFGDIGEPLWQQVEGFLDDQIAAIENKTYTGTPDEIRDAQLQDEQLLLLWSSLRKAFGEGAPIGALGAMAAAFVLPLVMAFITQGYFSGFQQKAMQQGMRWAEPTLLTPDELTKLRNLDEIEGGTTYLTDYGASTVAPNFKVVDESEYKESMRRHGYNGENRDRLKRLLTSYGTPADIISMVRWGTLDRAMAVERLGLLGLDRTTIEYMLKSIYPPPGVQDILQMVVREVFRPDIVEKYGTDELQPGEMRTNVRNPSYTLDSDLLREFEGDIYRVPSDRLPEDAFYTVNQIAEVIGLSPEWLANYWRSHWELPSVGQAFQMYWRTVKRPLTGFFPEGAGRVTLEGETQPLNDYYTVISKETLEQLMLTKDILPYFIPKLQEIAYHPISRVDVRRIYSTIPDKFTIQDVEIAYRNLGYSPENAKLIAEWIEQLYSNEKKEAVKKERDLTKSMVLSMFDDYLMGYDDSLQYLKDMGYDDVEADLIMIQAKTNREIDELKVELRTITDRVTRGVITKEQALDTIAAMGLPNDLMLQQLQKIDKAVIDIQSKTPSLAELKAFAKAGVLPREGFISGLNSLGILPSWQPYYVSMSYLVKPPFPNTEARTVIIAQLFENTTLTFSEATRELKQLGLTDEQITEALSIGVDKLFEGVPPDIDLVGGLPQQLRDRAFEIMEEYFADDDVEDTTELAERLGLEGLSDDEIEALIDTQI